MTLLTHKIGHLPGNPGRVGAAEAVQGVFSSVHPALIEHLLFGRYRAGPFGGFLSLCGVDGGECVCGGQRRMSLENTVFSFCVRFKVTGLSLMKGPR